VRLTPLDIEVAIDAPDKQPELPAPVQTAAFRVLQEAIANVAKHARASHVRIALHAGSDALTASVKDDGQGFVPSAVRAATVAGVATLGGLDAHRAGLGLLGMQERVTLLGGTLEVRSAPGRGTLVEFTIPITGAVEAPDATAPEIATQEFVPA
jgi:signal transduction histidine kinase